MYRSDFFVTLIHCISCYTFDYLFILQWAFGLHSLIWLTVSWTWLYKFFWVLSFDFFLCIPKWCVSCSFSNESFEKLCHCFHSGAVFYVPTKRIRGSYFVNTFQHLVFSGFIYYFAILNLMSINWHFIVILICISPVNGIEMFFLKKCLFKCMVHFSTILSFVVEF